MKKQQHMEKHHIAFPKADICFGKNGLEPLTQPSPNVWLALGSPIERGQLS